MKNKIGNWELSEQNERTIVQGSGYLRYLCLDNKHHPRWNPKEGEHFDDEPHRKLDRVGCFLMYDQGCLIIKKILLLLLFLLFPNHLIVLIIINSNISRFKMFCS